MEGILMAFFIGLGIGFVCGIAATWTIKTGLRDNSRGADRVRNGIDNSSERASAIADGLDNVSSGIESAQNHNRRATDGITNAQNILAGIRARGDGTAGNAD